MAKNINISDDAWRKLQELLTCGNERVELSAAKEVISLLDKDDESEDKDIQLDVTIKIVGEQV